MDPHVTRLMEEYGFTRPNIARVYNALAGGHDNLAPDQELAERLEQIYAPLPALVQDNRAFLARVVIWAGGERISQFLDLGAGLPLPAPLHEAARSVIPQARYVYVDNDGLAASHARALLAVQPGIAASDADLADPAGVLADPAVLASIDLQQPVCVLFGCVLHIWDADAARAITAGYAQMLAPGSLIVVSVVRNDDPDLLQQIRAAYTPGALHNHSREDITAFLGGLELVPPGVVLAHGWRGGWLQPGPLRPPGPAYVLAAVARKR